MGMKSSIITLVGTLLLGIFVGYKWGHQPKVVTQTQESNTTRTVIKTIKDKAGREKTVTTIDSKTDVVVKKQENMTTKSSKTNISALIGNDFSKRLSQPIYGVSVSREYWGAITIGGFGLTNGVVGVSIGLNF